MDLEPIQAPIYPNEVTLKDVTPWRGIEPNLFGTSLVVLRLSQARAGPNRIYRVSVGSGSIYNLLPSCQKAMALAAATFKESTPWDMGMQTV